jgi:hypothetical protein
MFAAVEFGDFRFALRPTNARSHAGAPRPCRVVVSDSGLEVLSGDRSQLTPYLRLSRALLRDCSVAGCDCVVRLPSKTLCIALTAPSERVAAAVHGLLCSTRDEPAATSSGAAAHVLEAAAAMRGSSAPSIFASPRAYLRPLDAFTASDATPVSMTEHEHSLLTRSSRLLTH